MGKNEKVANQHFFPIPNVDFFFREVKGFFFDSFCTL